MRISLNVGWLGVASTVVLGAVALVACYVQEASRTTDESRSWSAAAQMESASTSAPRSLVGMP